MSFLPLFSAVLMSVAGDPAADERLPERLALLEADPAAAENPWRIDIALYFWLADFEGDISIRSVTAEADAEFADLFDHLKMALMLHVELWHKDRLGVITDMSWTAFEDNGEVGTGESSVTSAMGITDAVGAFRLREEAIFVDLLAGLRWILLDTEVEITGVPKESEAHAYLDPIIGLRFGAEAADWLLFTFRVDVGGFGIGTDAEASTTALAVFRITPAIAAIAGYRAFAMEVADDNSSVDLRIKGPLLAIDVGF